VPLLSSPPEGSQSRYNTQYNVSFPEFPTFQMQPAQVIIRQKERHHDIAILRYTKQTPFFGKALKTGTPVKITWQNSEKAKGSFYGYVMSYKRTRAAQVDHEIDIHCIETSLPLKDMHNNVWTNKTLSEVVQDIAKKTKLKAVFTPNPTRFSQISQYGLSYWELLQDLAYKAGYVAWVKNATIYFKSFDDILNKGFNNIPLLEFRDEFVPPFSSWEERTLDKFEPILGDLVENEDRPLNAHKFIGAVDPIKPKAISSNNSPKGKVKKTPTQVLFNDNSSFDVANSKYFADHLTKAKAERAKFSVPAHFYAQGDPRIAPYSFVEISGIDDITDGYWMVSSVTHIFGREGVYHSDGVVFTDGRGKNVRSQPKSKTGKPYLNLTGYANGDSLAKPKSPSLNKTNALYNQKNSGYTITPQKWRA
jgi:hypothetical protein